VIVDAVAFAGENPDAAPVLDTVVAVPQVAKKLSLRECFESALRQIPTQNATIAVRRGYVEVTTFARANGNPTRGMVGPDTFEGPLEKVLEELADITGGNIIIDTRVKEQAKTAVKARFLNKVELETALSVLTDMAGLAWAAYFDAGRGAIYVTTRE